MKILLLVNPSSKGGRGIKRLPRLRKLLCKENIEFNEVILSSIDEAFERAKTLDTSLYDAVVAAGGDGTIRAVGEGVLGHEDPHVKMGVLYTGTSPDFCKFHNIPLDLAEAVRSLKKCRIKSVPVLTANGKPFFCSCNPGMGAEVAARANRWRPYWGDFCGTLLALGMSLLKNRRYTFKVNDQIINECNHLLFTRMPYIAGGLKVPVPLLKENEFLLWYLQDVSRSKYLQILPRLYGGKPCGKWQIFSDEVILEAPENAEIPFEYDGDPQGKLPLTIKLSPRRLNLIVPSGELPQ